MLLFVAVSVTMMAQGKRVEGILIDRDSKEAVAMATVQLLKTDSTYVAGAVSKDNGLFIVQAPANGQYLLKISNVGYNTMIKKVVIANDKDLNMGKLQFSAEAIMLEGVTATAMAKKIVVVEDTFVYNSAAYRTPEGSAVEELIRLIPGASVDDEGNVTINGKSVKKIKMDGKEFMNGDTKTAIKNLPTSIIENIKAYEGKSDRARITGIEDGEDEMTLDFTIKAGMNKGVLGNLDLGYGTHDRYAERLMLGLFKDEFKIMSFGNFNNVNDAGFGGRGGGFGRNRNGLNTSNMVGVNLNYEGDKLKADGSVRWNHNTSDQYTQNSSESFVIGNQSFSNSLSQNYSKNKSWNAQMRFEWTPDTLTNIMFRPSISWRDNDGRGGSASATFDADPFEYTDLTVAQLSDIIEIMSNPDKNSAHKNLAKNSKTGSSLSYGDSKSVNGWFQFYRKLNSAGRGITFNANGSYSQSNNKNFSTQNVVLYQKENGDYSINRWNITPSTNWSYNVQVSYSEPIAKKTYLQFSYKYSHSYQKSDRATYDMDYNRLISDGHQDYVNLLASLGINNIPAYRSWGTYSLDDPSFYGQYKSDSLSRFSEYKTDSHDIEIQFRKVSDNYNFNFGVLAQPQHTSLYQRYLGENAFSRNVFNWSPTADFRYYFTKQHQLRFNYRGTTSQPSMAQMVEITDNSDPMNITKGNKDLKPSFTNSLRLFYNNYITSHTQNILLYANYSNTRNSTVQSVEYDASTGGRTSTYKNINGNWNASLGGEYSIALDSIGRWYVTNSPNYSFNNNVGLVNEGGLSQKNITKVHNIQDRLSLSFRNAWLNIDADGSFGYTKSTNLLQANANLNTWTYSYGGSMQISLPWSMQLSTDLHMRSRRGYTDSSLNTNELIWNAQISQSLLRGKPLTLSLQFYDILHNQSNLTRSLTAMARTDTEYNSINSYAMFHVIYRFNFMGGKSQMDQGFPGGRPDFNREEFRRRGGQGGGMPGGGMPGGGRGGFGGGFGGPR